MSFWKIGLKVALASGLACGAAAGAAHAQGAACKEMRPLKIGVAVVPPNVVHTTPYVAKELGLFEKHCIAPEIIAFEGGASAALSAALQQGEIIANVTDIMVGNGMKAHQVWGFAPKLPQSYMVSAEVKTPADLKGKRLSAAGGGVGGFNWRMGRAMLADAGLTVDDAVWVSQGLAGRLPGLLTGQLDGVSLHPEDVYLAQKQKPELHVLSVLAEKMPDYVFNMYGAADSMIARDRPLLVDAMAAMIEANRAMYQQRDKVVPIIAKATEKPEEAVRAAMDVLTKNCVWAVNTGFDRARMEWTAENNVEIGDIPKETKPSYEQLVDDSIAREAVAKAGGEAEINGCKI
ncbi:ABC transporter substrate-binding protein [Propylenella binzhouense]|uniref:ABC transporter substrate-binding protein n=1 Tax=Propylenella binzhouense TaxID=2555902 RepID=A0A964T853_9HYPH|nr:ABC transporter substrate-binding protein [Propylenella binzhouense]MYZ50321.1 ABC transporter substrate-binding protein [Propylenella binzhouense]